MLRSVLFRAYSQRCGALINDTPVHTAPGIAFSSGTIIMEALIKAAGIISDARKSVTECVVK